MGLSIGFITLPEKDELAFLRNHWTLADSFFELDPPPYEADSSDFYVEDWMIEEVADHWEIEDPEVVRAETTMSEADFERICRTHEDCCDIEDRRAAYRRLLMRLQKTVSSAGPVVCYWSA